MSTLSLAQKLHNHVLSGAGITAVRTRDPMATINACVAFCSTNKRPLKLWDAARGWLSSTDPVVSVGDGSLDLTKVFQSLLNPTPSTDLPAKGLYVFTMVHHHLSAQRPNPQLLQLLTIMAHNLPEAETERRVVVCIPPTFTFPPELRELIPVIDHAAPGLDDIRMSLDNVLVDLSGTSGRYMPTMTDNEMQRLAQAGAGMITPDIENAFSRVVFNAGVEKKNQTAESLRVGLLRAKADMVKRSKALEVLDTIPLDQVGGLNPLKDWVATRVKAMDPAAWAMGVDKPKGCALVGPPGTGKSLLGKVIGSVLGVATIRFDISSVFQGLVGSSEENMREALFMLESLAPCVVLLDEIDKVVSTGGSGDSGVSQKVLGALLTFMQETQAAIFWVPTLNRTENVPAELMRAGRLDEVFGVAKPNEQERAEILTIHLRKRQVDVDAMGDMYDVVQAMDGFVGAEIEGVASAARLAAYNEGDDAPVTVDHVLAAARATKPLSKKMAEQFTAMENWCKEHAVAANDVASIPMEAPTVRHRRRRGGGTATDAPSKRKVH